MKNYKVTAQDPTNNNEQFVRTLSGHSDLSRAEMEAFLLFGEANVISVEIAPDTMDITPKNMMHIFVMFSLNYDYGFIEKAFAGNMPDHLQCKFNSLYDKYGANAVMVRFWCELDLQNQELLANYIFKQKEIL